MDPSQFNFSCYYGTICDHTHYLFMIQLLFIWEKKNKTNLFIQYSCAIQIMMNELWFLFNIFLFFHKFSSTTQYKTFCFDSEYYKNSKNRFHHLFIQNWFLSLSFVLNFYCYVYNYFYPLLTISCEMKSSIFENLVSSIVDCS